LSNYDDPSLLGAFWVTVQLTVFSAIGSLVWGTLLAAMRVSPVPLMRGFATTYVNVVRNIPLTVIIVFTSLGLADIFGVAMGAPVRTGIKSVSVGRAEAGRGLGLSCSQVLRLVVLPQAFRSVIGPLANVVIALPKNTTVAATIGGAEAALLMKERVESEAQP